MSTKFLDITILSEH